MAEYLALKQTTLKLIDKILSESSLADNVPYIAEAVQTICSSYKNGGYTFICGNGGSASDSEHIVGELVKAFLKKRNVDKEFKNRFLKEFPGDKALIEKTQIGFPAFSLTSQTAIMTAINNDIGGEYVFSQQAYAYIRQNDVFIGISTSGNSVAVCNAAKIAKAKGAKIIILTGENGGELRNFADILLRSTHGETYRVQQDHIVLYHALCAGIEEELV